MTGQPVLPPDHTEATLIARAFHEAYERLAPEYGYKTREASAVPWDDVPENNRALMVATVSAALAALLAEREALVAVAQAARALQRLKDGPRDMTYEAAKPTAWDDLRAALGRLNQEPA